VRKCGNSAQHSQWLFLEVVAVVCHMVSCAGCAAYGSQMSQTIALKMVEASLATAMSYLSVVWGMLSGYLVFHEVCCPVTQILQMHYRCVLPFVDMTLGHHAGFEQLSLAGASLVCSCTVVLALAEQLSAAKTNQQHVWWHKAWTKLVDWSTDCTRRLVCFWHACHRNRALYERVNGNDLDSSN